MDRYNIIEEKNKREIVLLKGFPCIWGKCTFCDYIDDNSTKEEEINKLNFEVLDNVNGVYKTLEVINSGSCFELPKETLKKIKEVINRNGIKKIFLESHWCYKNRLQEMRDFFGIEIVFKIGVESFDNDFRNKFLNKNANFKTYEEVKENFQSVCLLVGIKGQNKKMIKRDIDIVLHHFHYGTVNIFTENTTEIKRDEELIKWFEKEYQFLRDVEKIEILFENTDFGVGD
ncbi:radical SAM protein [Clostridium botulinum]|uniref:radical SAM protein n=1 Tax=Clostridium TaxID=1485 RepID=UPI000503AE1D|nr:MULTISPECIES: radical SAM protein [unclassified Clostridium]AIY79968.1 putative radical SAM domain protein [Clostridium botulinum 202F]KAI3347724.1 radical SAM protein [Clostridium botulinum]KFX56940.1 radical SAM protein [Clostridium botulinum]KFX59479.1 radical SAM protein [Clostridium botulinum]KON14481.1 radical SAM protein [Clostridium botulinum]